MEDYRSDQCSGGQLNSTLSCASISCQLIGIRYSQTSITISDVIYVVDTGKVKENQFDPENGLSKLIETWVTRAAARQRRGRAGRTQPGMCYKLYTRKQEDHMTEFPVPEILRVPLESISLAVKVMREGEDVKVGIPFFFRPLDLIKCRCF
jgi:ATP-dependent RNA helicase DHX57